MGEWILCRKQGLMRWWGWSRTQRQSLEMVASGEEEHRSHIWPLCIPSVPKGKSSPHVGGQAGCVCASALSQSYLPLRPLHKWPKSKILCNDFKVHVVQGKSLQPWQTDPSHHFLVRRGETWFRLKSDWTSMNHSICLTLLPAKTIPSCCCLGLGESIQAFL